MSHIVTISTEVRDPAAITAACRRIGLPEPVHGTAKLFEGEATGLLVRLPDWLYPCVVDTTTGAIRYDNFGGSWGDPIHLDRFMQMDKIEKARIEAKKRGHSVTEQSLADGSIKLTISVGGCRMGTIEITVSPRGETKVETRGFTGDASRDASKFVEQALGTRTAETLTTEFYQRQESTQELRQAP